MRRMVSGLLLVACMGTASGATPKEVVLHVENMTCPACSITIGKALDKLPGIREREIDTGAATVTIGFDAERTSAASIARAVTEAGFPARAIPGDD